jgi:oligoribonuclease
MPRLEAHFHYRNFDVSVFKEAARRWRPEIVKGFNKESKHEALLDVRESIEEMRYYLNCFIVPR